MNNKTKMLLTSSAAGLLAALLAATAAASDGLLSPGLDVIAEDAGVVLSGQYEHDILLGAGLRRGSRSRPRQAHHHPQSPDRRKTEAW